MNISIIKMSYLVNGSFVQLTVKSDGKAYTLLVDGEQHDDVFESAQAAVAVGMEFIENCMGES